MCVVGALLCWLFFGLLNLVWQRSFKTPHSGLLRLTLEFSSAI